MMQMFAVMTLEFLMLVFLKLCLDASSFLAASAKLLHRAVHELFVEYIYTCVMDLIFIISHLDLQLSASLRASSLCLLSSQGYHRPNHYIATQGEEPLCST